jgi:hypothetical protein
MAAPLPLPPSGVPIFDQTTGGVSPQWQNYFNQLAISITTGSAPANAPFVTTTSDPTLTNEVNLGLLASGILAISVTLGVATISSLPTATTTWTPADGSGAALALTVNSATYARLGSLVALQGDITYPVTVDASNSLISGLPFAAIAANLVLADGGNFGAAYVPQVNASAATLEFISTAGVRLTNAGLSGANLKFTGVYRT